MRAFDAINVRPDKRFQKFLDEMSYNPKTKKGVEVRELEERPLRNNAMVWYYALCYAVKKKLKPKKIDKPFNLIGASVFSEEQQTFMILIAINMKGKEIITDVNGMLRICNELACAGLDDIQNKVQKGSEGLDNLFVLAEIMREMLK